MSTSTTVPRRADVTPTSQGRFHPPSAPVSGARSRRGFTPRSAASKKLNPGGDDKPKPKFTVEQQLDILRKIKSGNFKLDEGLEQFCEKIPPVMNSSVVSKMTCKQNLFSSFASMDHSTPLASSTRLYGSGKAGSEESLISPSSSILSVVPSHSRTIMDTNTTIADSEMGVTPPNFESLLGDFDSNERLPDYIKLVDELIREQEGYLNEMNDLARVWSRAKFSELLPREKMINFFKSIKRIKNIIQKFLKGNASENMNLFMPSELTKGSSSPSFIPCDIEKSASVIQNFQKLAEIMNELKEFINESPKDYTLGRKVESLNELADQLEDLIKQQEEYFLLTKDLKKTSELQLDSVDTEMKYMVLN